MSLNKRAEMLKDGKLFDTYLYERLDRALKKRNGLMHRRQQVSPRDSSECQTVVRDLWAFCIDTPFELTTSWSYRHSFID